MQETQKFSVESPFVRRVRNANATTRLICFPHAGAGASVFAEWTRHLPADVELVAVQLPGREDRVTERPLTSLGTAVRTVALALRPLLRGRYALFGHSVGGLLAFELTRALAGRGAPGPEHLFVSGLVPPDEPLGLPVLHELPDDRFRDAVRGLGGTEDAARDERLMDLLLPTLRADFTLGETHRFRPGPPLDVPVTALGGDDDDRAPRPALRAWQRHTTAPLDVRVFPGGHFYLTDQAPQVTDAISAVLRGAAQQQERSA